ncbi:MAG TPA: hypothetical protein DCP54_09585 [Chryseobacterium sp.]|nr:hypothetical protein [Chryseobacterium sp.]
MQKAFQFLELNPAIRYIFFFFLQKRKRMPLLGASEHFGIYDSETSTNYQPKNVYLQKFWASKVEVTHS